MTTESSFNYNNFLTKKQTLETDIDKFKSISENYDTTSDPSYVTFNNISLPDLPSFTTISNTDTNTDCKALCSTDTGCVAHAFVDGSCNKYSNSNCTYSMSCDFTDDALPHCFNSLDVPTRINGRYMSNSI